MKNMWMVMNIGCLECGVSSAVVGVFADKARADAIAAECYEKYNWRERGENAFYVFKLPETEQIALEYEVGSQNGE